MSANINIEQVLALASLAAKTVQEGKVAISEVLNFFESKGADAAELAKNRALLESDIAGIQAELKGNG